MIKLKLFFVFFVLNSAISYADCLDGSGFIYSVAKLNKLAIGQKQLSIEYNSKVIRKGVASGAFLLGNLITLKYEFPNNSQGVMLIGHDLKLEKYSLIQFLESDKIIKEVSIGKFNYDMCQIKFNSSNKNQSVVFDLSDNENLIINIYQSDEHLTYQFKSFL